jgi:hypothetical protein
MGGTGTAKQHYLNREERYRYRKWAYLSDGRYQCRKGALSEWRWEVPVPQMSIIWIRMKDTGTVPQITWLVMRGTSAANEHYLTGDWRYQYRKWAHLTGDERHAANGDDLPAALTQLYQHRLDIAAQLLDTVVLRLCLQNLRISLEAR